MADATEVVRRAPFGENPLVGERGADTQRRILQAALDVFAEHGYHETGVELITEAAGCSRPAFYQYFSSKEDLFWRLAGHLARDMGEHAEGIGPITADAEGVGRLREWLDSFIDLCSAYDPILAGYQAAARERRPDVKDTRSIGNRVGAALVAAAGSGHPELDRPALTNTMVAVVMRTITYWQIGLGQLGRRRFVGGLAQTIHRILHGPVDGVNVGPATKAPPKREPRWPVFPGTPEHDPALRPRGRRTRELLLDAGSRVLPQRGYHNTRVDDIVAEAGVSHGSFYRYFANKDELFHVLAEQAAMAMVELVSTFPEDGDPVSLRHWLEGWFRTYRENGGVISAWQEIGYDDDPELQAFSIEVAMVVFDRLRRIVHRRGFGDNTVDAIVLLSVVERMPYSVLAMQHLRESEAIDASAFIVRRGLLGADVD
ncbi:MAG TPA: TetR/AcrR family transcriptional regulator [Acidimicrobiales bacterium]|nr:TetR/AcrR family transcriptional regulator [Acidimicrobiales bacterium]